MWAALHPRRLHRSVRKSESFAHRSHRQASDQIAEHALQSQPYSHACHANTRYQCRDIHSRRAQRDDKRESTTMHKMSIVYSNAIMDDIAAYYASQPRGKR